MTAPPPLQYINPTYTFCDVPTTLLLYNCVFAYVNDKFTYFFFVCALFFWISNYRVTFTLDLLLPVHILKLDRSRVCDFDRQVALVAFMLH